MCRFLLTSKALNLNTLPLHYWVSIPFSQMAQTSLSHILRRVIKDSIEWMGNLRSINNHNDPLLYHSLESHLPRCLINPDQGQILRRELKCKFFFKNIPKFEIQNITNIRAFAFCALLRCHLYFFCEFIVWVLLPDIWWIMVTMLTSSDKGTTGTKLPGARRGAA